MFLEGLDQLDQKIVRLLIENARMSYSDIGKAVGISRVAVKARIRALLRRSSLSKIPEDNPRMYLGSGPVQVDCASGKTYINGETLELTGMEYRLLCLFLRHPSQILSREQILDTLWDGRGNFVDDNTLSVYIRRLREKIEQTPSRPQHLLTIRGMGYRWEEHAHESSV